MAWKLENGILTLSGIDDGVISCSSYKYTSETHAPWYADRLSINTIVLEKAVLRVDDYLFDGCENVTTLIATGSLSVIGEYAFNDCYSLKTIQGADGLRLIENYAFNNCMNLKEIRLPSSMEVVDNHTFYNSGIENAVFEGRILGTSIYGFQDSKSLKHITISGGGVNPVLGNRCFYNCSSLEDIIIPDTIVGLGYDIFKNCSSLKEIRIPKSVYNIQMSAFEGCTNLKKVVFETGDEPVKGGGLRFKNCKSLIEVILPENLGWIGVSDFEGCVSLKNLDIPESVTHINPRAFSGCTALKELILPADIKNIGEEAFLGCSSLKNIYFTGSAPIYRIDKNAFKGVTANVYYPWKEQGWIWQSNTFKTDVKQQYGGNIKWIPYPSAYVRLSSSDITLSTGESKKVSASGLVTDDKVVGWKTSNSEVASVDNNGNIKGLTPGTATVTVMLLSGLEKSVKVTVKVAPAAITGLYNSSKGGDLRWKPVTGAEKYVIYRTNGGKTVKLATVNASSTSYMDTSIKDNCWGKVYVYYVHSQAGSVISSRGEGKTLQRLAPMTINYCKNDKSRTATLKWAVASGSNKAAGYELQYAENTSDLYGQKGSFKKVAVDGRNSLSKAIYGLTKGKTYCFRVRAYVNYTHSVTKTTTKTWSQYSNVVSVKIVK